MAGRCGLAVSAHAFRIIALATAPSSRITWRTFPCSLPEHLAVGVAGVRRRPRAGNDGFAIVRRCRAIHTLASVRTHCSSRQLAIVQALVPGVTSTWRCKDCRSRRRS